MAPWKIILISVLSSACTMTIIAFFLFPHAEHQAPIQVAPPAPSKLEQKVAVDPEKIISGEELTRLNAETGPNKEKCEQLMKKYCPDKKNEGACVAKNASVLREACPHATSSVEKEMLPCRLDIQNFCANVEMGGGRIVKCLLQHRNDIAMKCREWAEDRAAHLL